MGQFSAALKQRGYRLTLQRELILDAVESLTGHVSAEDVYGRIRERFPQVNISTVYRTLELLEQEGFVAHTHFDDGVAKWHRIEEGTHQHLVCRDCGREQELEIEILEPLARQLRERYGFQADVAHFAIVGICSDCDEGDKKGSSSV